MRKLKNFIPPKPVVEPFGPGSGQAHTFSKLRDGVKAIVETDAGNVIVVQEKPDGTHAGYLHLSGGGYGRLEDDELKPFIPREEKSK